MGRKSDMRAALECRQPEQSVPLWELHFHCWEQVSGKRFVSGREFEALAPRQRARALQQDADIVVEGLPDGIFGSLLRALVIALLLPARVLGIGLGRGIQALVRLPIAILKFLGRVGVVLLGGIILFLIAVSLFMLLA